MAVNVIVRDVAVDKFDENDGNTVIQVERFPLPVFLYCDI